MSREPSRARTRSVRSLAACGSDPYSAATRQLRTSSPAVSPSSVGSSTERRSAARTVSRCSARTPAAAGRTPGRSGRAMRSSTPTGSGPPSSDAGSGRVRRDRTGSPVRRASMARRSCSASGASGSGAGGSSPARRAATRLTRSATREARQELHAAGPVARASASVRACRSSRVEALPTAVATERTVAGSSRSRRVAVSMSSRWWRTRVATTATSCLSKPMRAAMSRAMTSPATEWSPGQPLPMSWSRAAISRRAVRPAVHPLPVRQQAGDDALRLQRLPDGDGGPAGAEEGDEFLAGPGGPRDGERLCRGAQVAYEVAGERQPRLRRRGGGPEGEHGVAFGAGGAREDDLAVGLDHAFGERGALRCGLGAAEDRPQPRPCGAGAQDAVDLAPGDVGGVGDGAGGLVDLAQQGVGVEQAEGPGDLVLLLQGEAVGGPAGGQVERVARVEQGTAGFREAFARGVR